MLRKVPLIIILGSTGTGKTRLSLELAERLGGEIISADSMQVYANLNVVTAKATREERARVRHHLLDVATPGEPYTVLNFRNAAMPILEDLLARSKCPIVVGGTNYYIESLLWDILVDPKKSSQESGKHAAPPAEVKHLGGGADGDAIYTEQPGECSFLSNATLSSMSSDMLHQHLAQIDPASAQRIHPNNKRKIVRAIEVFQQSGGQTLTSLLEQQRQQPGANRLGGPLRFPHTILFWLRCNQDVLNERLDKRVDSMLQQGLLQEIRDFQTKHLTKGDKSLENPYTKGVLQTIGFKEFVPYLQKYSSEDDRRIEEYLERNDYRLPAVDTKNKKKAKTNGDADPPDHPVPAGLDLLNACLEQLKLVTKRYSRKQIKWINNRFLASKDRQVPDLYELDTSDVSKWNEEVFARAVAVVDCYRENRVCEVQPMPKRVHPGEGLDEETSHFCDICERTFIGDFQYGLHMKSIKHKRRREGLQKQAKLLSAASKADATEDTAAAAAASSSRPTEEN